MRIQMQNEIRRKVINQQKEKIDQRQLSKTLVLAFKQCVDNMMKNKKLNIEEHSKNYLAKEKK